VLKLERPTLAICVYSARNKNEKEFHEKELKVEKLSLEVTLCSIII